MPDRFRIAVVGGGLAGAAFALHLLRDNPALEADLTVVEPREKLGAGLAYSAQATEHRTNVAATRMSLFPEEPDHFDAWLRAHGEPQRDASSVVPETGLFPSRAVYGRYADAMLAEAVAAHSGIAFTHIRAHAEALDYDLGIALGDGTTLAADIAVLAIGHTTPDLPAVLHGVPGVIADPWDLPALRAIPTDARVLVVGTGLTACDVIASLHRAGHRGPVTALSRHGLLPRPRTRLPVNAEGDFSTDPEHTALGLLVRARAAIATAADAGRPWEGVIDALRQQSAAAWGTLDWNQRGRLLRHLRTFWDVHRFQCAPQIDATIAAMRESGALTIVAASLLHAEAGSVRIRRRGRAGTETLEFDTVVNCTGPGHRSVTAQHPVLRSLAEAGLLQPDPVRLGILVDTDSRVIKADGTAWPTLFVAGPLARGTHGELMGLPQVNLQPRAVASSVAAMVSRVPAVMRAHLENCR